jgi:hypothetical protein
MRTFLTDCVAPMVAGLAIAGAIILALSSVEQKAAHRVPHVDPVRLCPIDGEAMQWPCKDIPWEGRA